MVVHHLEIQSTATTTRVNSASHASDANCVILTAHPRPSISLRLSLLNGMGCGQSIIMLCYSNPKDGHSAKPLALKFNFNS